VTGSPVGLIARREIVTRLQQRGYRISVAISLVIVVIACVLPAFFRGANKPSHYDVAVVAEVPGLPDALEAVAAAQHVEVTVHRGDAETARERVRSGSWDAAVLPGGQLVVQHRSDDVVPLVQAADQLARTVANLRTAGLSQQQVAAALHVMPLSVHATASTQNAQKQAIALIAVIVLFSQLITFCTWVAMGVVEEKSSRVVELILSSVRPVQLLAGKLTGIGILAAAQVLLLGVAAVMAATAAKTLTLPAAGVLTLVVAFVAFLLGYVFFGALAAGLGSTVSRQEEVSGILAPVSITLTVSYAASFAVAGSPGSGLARAVSIVPPFSTIAMPARIAHGGVSLLDVLLSVGLLLAAAVGIVLVAARVYRASILHSGTRVPLRTAWRDAGTRGVADIS
jgi:ABC-2 type transport system permease protein